MTAEQQSVWLTEAEKDHILHTLAKRYHDETEAYDRTVCTGPIIRGSIQTGNTHELGLVGRNARDTSAKIMLEASQYEISTTEMWCAIAKYDDRGDQG